RRVCECVRRKNDGLRFGPPCGVLRHSSHSKNRAGSRSGGLSLVVDSLGYGQKHSVSDEEVAEMIFKKAIPRRTFIRGAGVTLALPLLDGMIPAFAAPEKPVKRFSIVYVPNGRIMERWTPTKEGADFELPLLLQPFAPFRDRLLVITGLTLNVAKHAPG